MPVGAWMGVNVFLVSFLAAFYFFWMGFGTLFSTLIGMFEFSDVVGAWVAICCIICRAAGGSWANIFWKSIACWVEPKFACFFSGFGHAF